MTSSEKVWFLFFFDVDHFLSLEIVPVLLLLFYVLVFWSRGMWDFSFPSRMEPTLPALESEILTPGLQGSLSDNA